MGIGAGGSADKGSSLLASDVGPVAAHLSVRFLVRYFETNWLTPFAVYCVIAGIAASVYLAVAY